MPGPMLTIADLLRGAADALKEAYRGREDVPPASLALIVALRSVLSTSRLEKPSWTNLSRQRRLLLRTNRSASNGAASGGELTS
jgi:hypothetical protein